MESRGTVITQTFHASSSTGKRLIGVMLAIDFSRITSSQQILFNTKDWPQWAPCARCGPQHDLLSLAPVCIYLAHQGWKNEHPIPLITLCIVFSAPTASLARDKTLMAYNSVEDMDHAESFLGVCVCVFQRPWKWCLWWSRICGSKGGLQVIELTTCGLLSQHVQEGNTCVYPVAAEGSGQHGHLLLQQFGV